MTVRAFGRRFEAVVLDVDGVLLDTAAGTHGVGLEDGIAVMTSGTGGEVEPTAAAALLRRPAEEHVPPAAVPMSGTLEAIERIRRGIPVAIASSSERPVLERLLETGGHADPVDVVISAGDVAAPKPAPDATAARAAGCSVVHFAPEDGTASTPRAVDTVRSHRDLILRSGLLPRPGTDGEERP